MSTLKEPFWRTHLPAISIGLLDVFLIGMGMGVPFFAILLGFGVGWWLARRPAPVTPVPDDPVRIRARSLLGSAGSLAALSFFILLAAGNLATTQEVLARLRTETGKAIGEAVLATHRDAWWWD